MKIEESEQWQLDGDCKKCRRKKYCSKPCTRCNRRSRAEMQAMVSYMMDKMTGGVMSEMKERINNSR